MIQYHSRQLYPVMNLGGDSHLTHRVGGGWVAPITHLSSSQHLGQCISNTLLHQFRFVEAVLAVEVFFIIIFVQLLQRRRYLHIFGETYLVSLLFRAKVLVYVLHLHPLSRIFYTSFFLYVQTALQVCVSVVDFSF